ncbi:MAG: protein kinase [Acidobacteria bacterium]|nr:protein kinase [Acidobacteriota bacterium]
MTPRNFEGFDIVRKLPAGGMGRVYEAVEASTGRRVALKLIDHGSDSDTRQIVDAERVGAELHKRLCAEDARITSVIGTGDTEDYFYIVMEYVDGQDLSELAAVERIGYLFAARIAQDVLEVLNIAHSFATAIDGKEYRGIVHGDIKPRNIRMTTTGQTKVLDFGIAKALSATRSFTQNVFGSVQYSSPERLETGEVTISSDLWAVGVVLYEMLARRPYFQADSAAKFDRLIRGYCQFQPFAEEWPEALKAILRRALDPDPALRYPSAGEFAEDLSAFRSDRVPAAVHFDAEATRRTARTVDGDTGTRRTLVTDAPTGDLEATRRTSPAPAAEASLSAKPAPAAAKAKDGPRWGRIATVAFVVLGAVTGIFGVREYLTFKDARALSRDLESERVTRTDTAWERYQALSNKALMGWTVWPAQDAMRNRLMADAERVIAAYRGGDAVVTESDWVRARNTAAKALELVPRDKEVKSRLRTIDGHLFRIRGSSRRDANMLEQSREYYDEAAQLDPKTPDPWLGLARLYVYSTRDVDKGEAALKEAEKRHFGIGKRESAMLADGYLYRGERSFKEALAAPSDEERLKYLDLARKDIEKSKQLYESIVPWGGSVASLRKVNDDLDKLDGLKAPPDSSDSQRDNRPWWQRVIPGLTK